MDRMTAGLRYLTDKMPGIGGVIKSAPEDFVVDEQPLYEPCGSGEHLYLYVEKRSQTTTDVQRRIAKMFGVRRSDVGYAGLKDKHAVTRQLFSVYLPDRAKQERGLPRFEFTPFNLLWHNRHTNKLRRGHLRGNRFTIYIRDVDPAKVVVARSILDTLHRQGVPNFIGDQRFGYRQNNHIIGRHLLVGQWQAALDEMLGEPRDDDPPERHASREAYERGDFAEALAHCPRHLRHDRQALDGLRQGKSPRQAMEMIDYQQREFFVSSIQSAVFNRVLDQRIADDCFDRLLVGDLAWKHGNRSIFSVDEATAEKENGPGGRVGSFEVSPSGPMWGASMMRPTGEALQRELVGLAAFDLTESNLEIDHMQVKGSRRPLRVRLTDPQATGGVDEHGPYIRTSFELPRGSFATIVLREVMKQAVLEAPYPRRRERSDSGDRANGSQGDESSE